MAGPKSVLKENGVDVAEALEVGIDENFKLLFIEGMEDERRRLVEWLWVEELAVLGYIWYSDSDHYGYNKVFHERIWLKKDGREKVIINVK